MGVLALLQDPPATTYGVSQGSFEVIPGATQSPFYVVTGIDPVSALDLPGFDLRIAGFPDLNLDVYPHAYDRNGKVRAVLLRGAPNHNAVTGDAALDYPCEIVQRDAVAPLAVDVPQYTEPTALPSVKIEIDLPNGVGKRSTNLFSTLKESRQGIWTKETRHYAYITGGDDTPVLGFQTFVQWHSAADVGVVDLYVQNDLFEINDPNGVRARNSKTGGPCYLKTLKMLDLPPGWIIQHIHASASQTGDYLIAPEGAPTSFTTGPNGEFDPAVSRHPLANSWHVIPSRVVIHRRFVIRRAASSTEAEAREIYEGAGVARITGGELAQSRRGWMHAGALRRHDVPDSFSYNGQSGRAGLRAMMRNDWQAVLGKVQSGTDYGGMGSPRHGWYHLAGNSVGHIGGAQELLPLTGFYAMREEILSLRTECSGKIIRHAVGTTQWDTGNTLRNSQWTGANGGLQPYTQQVNDHDFKRWNAHYRADEFALNANLGNIDPGLNRHGGDGLPISGSVMPQDLLHNYPGQGQHCIQPPRVFPFSENDFADAPYEGAHHERWTHCYEGLADATGELQFAWLARREAEHIQACISEAPPDPAGIPPGEYFLYEMNMATCLDSFANHPYARPHHGSHGERNVGWVPFLLNPDGSQQLDEQGNPIPTPDPLGPRWIHRLAGESAMAVVIAARLTPNNAQKLGWRSWFHTFVKWASLRCDARGYGIKAYQEVDDQSQPWRPYNWGISNEQERDGGHPDYFVSCQSFFTMYVTRAVGAGAIWIGMDDAFHGSEWRRWITTTLPSLYHPEEPFGQKSPTAYHISVSHEVTGVHPLDVSPDGSINGTGNGLDPVRWPARRSKPSERAQLTEPTHWAQVWRPSIQATLDSKAIAWWGPIVAFYEEFPNEVPAGTHPLDDLRNTIEAVHEEKTGSRVWFTFDECLRECWRYWATSGVDAYWFRWDRARRMPGAAMIANWAHLLEKFPTWSTSGNDQGRLARPEGMSVTDTAQGLAVTWDALAGATGYVVEYDELTPYEGARFKKVTVAGGGTVSAEIPVADLPVGFNVNVRVSGIDSQGRRGTSTYIARISVGSGGTATPQSFQSGGGGGGGGGAAPLAAVIDSVTPVAGGVDLEVTFADTGVPTIVGRVEARTGSNPFEQTADGYNYLSALPGSGPTYTIPVRGLPEEEHDFRVIARAGTGADGPPSNEVSATPLPGGSGGVGSLPAPQNLVVTPMGDRIQLTFDAVPGAAVYYVGFGPDTPAQPSGGGGWAWFWQDTQSPTLVFGNLPSPGVATWVSVAATNDGNLGDAAEPTQISMPSTVLQTPGGGGNPDPPAAPTLGVPTVGDGQITVEILLP